MPESLKEIYGELVINTVSCAPTFAEVGAVEALTGPQDDVDAMVVEFKARRDLIVAGLNAIPGIRADADGCLLRLPGHQWDRVERCPARGAAAHEADVCVLAGTFGGVGVGHIRISYANSREEPDRGPGADRPVRRGPRAW